MRIVKITNPMNSDWCITKDKEYELHMDRHNVILRTPYSFSQTFLPIGRWKEYLQQGRAVFID